MTSKNLTEITSYSTKDANGNVYGSIDRDSAPDNVEMNSERTWEDDTDEAPGLTIKRDDVNKILGGTVFEDGYRPDADGNTTPNHPKEALGNGNYDNGENFVNGAKVRLVDAANGNTVKLYTLSNGRIQTKPAEENDITDTGKYEFVGLVPGVYYIEYEYGTYDNRRTVIVTNPEKEVTTEEYKSTVITNEALKLLVGNQIDSNGNWKSVNADTTKKTPEVGYWYLNKNGTSNSSSAIDDYVQRKNINDALKNINYNVKNKYDNRESSLGNIYLMTSRTPYLSVAIENDKFKTDGTTEDKNGEYQSTYETKFGIVVRPRQKFEIIKEISKVKLTLANGQVLLEGDPRNGTISSYLTYPDGGLLKIEVDNEIIQGATLEITYVMSATNLSAQNYNNIEYYLFGYNYDHPVTSKIKLIDYLDKEVMKIDPEADSTTWKWEGKTKEEMNGQVSAETINKSGDYNFYIPSDGYEEIKIEPGDKRDITSIMASKLLSSSDDMIFDNIVEIYNLENPVGRFYNGTPGNYDFVKEDAEEDNNKDPQRATVTVVPPTGTKEIIIYSLVGVGCLVILAGGIIFIKKKVL